MLPRRFAYALIIFLSVSVAVLGYLWQRDSRALRLAHAELGVPRAPFSSGPREAVALPGAAPAPRRVEDTPLRSATAPPSVNQPSRLSPQIAAQMKQQARWRKLSRKGSLLADLNLPAPTTEKFKDLLVERDYAEADARNAARQVGIEADSATAQEAMAIAVREIDAQIQSLLGEADFKKYTDLLAIDAFRADAAQSTVEGYLLDVGSPLTMEQSKSLARAFLEETLLRSRELETQPAAQDWPTRLQQSQSMILDRAQHFLSPAQLEGLRKFYRDDYDLAVAISTSAINGAPP